MQIYHTDMLFGPLNIYIKKKIQSFSGYFSHENSVVIYIDL